MLNSVRTVHYSESIYSISSVVMCLLLNPFSPVSLLCSHTYSCGSSSSFTVVGQRLSGTLPTEILALPNLLSITFAYNEFTGSIPSSYGSHQQLANLELHGNMLTGTIPDEFFVTLDENGHSYLQAFNVGDNLLTGTLSTGIGKLTSLKGLHIFRNHFHGKLPTEIGYLTRLTYTRISDNRFTGKKQGDRA